MVRRLGIGLAVVLRIILLFVLLSVIELFQDTLFTMNLFGSISGSFNLHSIIVLLGGGFILYTATKEIWHMVSIEDHATAKDSSPKSAAKVITLIVVMNLVFSFDSILSAIALTDVFWVMATAIVIGGALMILLADKISTFLQKNRMYEVLGLFILFLVGVMLLTEGGYLAELVLFDNPITPMSKTTFYFVIVVLIIVDIVQGRYQRKITKEKMKRTAATHQHT